MTEKFINSRIQLKVDTAENWGKAENFIPLEGELILYSDTQQIKLGDGITKVNKLPVYIENAKIQQTEDGGVIIGGQDSVASGAGAVAMGNGTTASGDGAIAMGEETVAAGDGSFAQGGKIFRSGAEPVTNAEGKYYAVLDGEYALAHPENCVDVATYPETEPPIVQTSDGMFCYLHDVRYAEAYGYASMTAGQGAVAYSRASKSLGYRTQTGYVTSSELAEKRPEAEKYSIKLSDFVITNTNNDGVIEENSFVGASNADLILSYIPLGGLFNFSATCMPIGVMNIHLIGIGAYEDNDEEVLLYSQDEPYTAGSKVEFSVEIPTYTKKLILRLMSDGTCDLVDVEMEFYPNDNTGQDAMAIGADTVAAANQSFAGGWKSKALAHAAFAFGMDNEVKGGSAASFGSYNKVNGANSLAIGDTNTINMNNSFAAGANNTVGGNQSIIVGSGNVTSGKTTQAIFGIGNNADRVGQTVVGLYNKTNTSDLFVVGAGTDASNPKNALEVGFGGTRVADRLNVGEGSTSAKHAVTIGNSDTKATAEYTMAFGNKATASKWGAVAMGDQVQSSGYNSFATGASTVASGNNSATFGDHTKATASVQMAVGRYNDPVEDASFMIGRGTSDTNRINSLMVKNNGNTEIKGNLSVGHLDVDSYVTDEEAGIVDTFTTHSGEIDIGPIEIRGYTSHGTVPGSEEFYFIAPGFKVNYTEDDFGNNASNLVVNNIINAQSNINYWDNIDSYTITMGDNLIKASSDTAEWGMIYNSSVEIADNTIKVQVNEQEPAYSRSVSFYDETLLEYDLNPSGYQRQLSFGDFKVEKGVSYDGGEEENSTLIMTGKSKLQGGLAVGTAEASTNTSIANGDSATQATKEYTLAHGRGSKATSWGAIALGDSNTSSNYNTLATGANTEATAANSATFGKGTKTTVSSSMAVGSYNQPVSGAAFMVGRGTSDTNRINSLLIKNNGNTELKGNLNVGHSDYIYNDALGVNEYITSGEINIGPITLRGYENDSPYSDSEFIFDSKYFSVSSIGDMYGNVKNELKLGQSLEIKDVDNINEASSFGEEYGKTQYITLGSLESYWANHGFDMEIYDKKTTLSDTLKVCTYSSYLENYTTLSFGSILEIKDGEFWETDNAVVKNEFILNGNSNFKKGMSIGAATFCDRIGLAIGDNASVQATGAVSVAIGGKNTSTGKATLANSQYTFAFGRGSQALSWGSIAFGDGNTAGASNTYTSMAFGANCTSTGSNAIACGSNNTAKITGSAVFGIGNKTAELPHEQVRQGQFICGTYNDNTTINNAKFVVGCGTGDTARKNAFVVRNTGDTEVTRHLSAKGIIKSYISDQVDEYSPVSGEIQIGDGSSISEYYGGHASGYRTFSLEGGDGNIKLISDNMDFGDNFHSELNVARAINLKYGYEYGRENFEGNIGKGLITLNKTKEFYANDHNAEIKIDELKIIKTNEMFSPGHRYIKEFSFTEDFSFKKVDESIYNDEIAGTVDSIYTTLTLNGTANITDLNVSGNLTLGGNKVPTFYSGTDMPDDSIGALGDIYIRTLGDA